MSHEELNTTNKYLYGFALLFKVFGTMTVSSSLNLLLTCLSIASVLMLIVINWDKFTERLKKIRVKKRIKRRK